LVFQSLAYATRIRLRVGGLQWAIKFSFEIHRRFGKTKPTGAYLT
jgi:hypothetical protein